MILALAIAGIVLAVLPTGLFLANLPLFAFSTDGAAAANGVRHDVSILIPARDEAGGIAACIAAALASRQVHAEVIVLDDHSTDSTGEIVRSLSKSDPRIRYVLGAQLPAGWNGKQFACRQLADAASHERLLFLDADVRLQPQALWQLIARQDATAVQLLSAFPHQETETVLEKLIVPLMHFILLGFLPLARMRANNQPAYAAGCGQLFLTKHQWYQRAGTHEAIKGSRHDGLKLPRIYRQAGLTTDVVDGSRLADCRMYRSAGEVVRGVLKNAIEGIAAPRLIVLFSVLLLGGSVLPVVTLAWGLAADSPLATALSLLGVLTGHLPRAVAAVRYRQSWLGAATHSLAILMFVVLQWVALANHLLGRQIAWRGRTAS